MITQAWTNRSKNRHLDQTTLREPHSKFFHLKKKKKNVKCLHKKTKRQNHHPAEENAIPNSLLFFFICIVLSNNLTRHSLTRHILCSVLIASQQSIPFGSKSLRPHPEKNVSYFYPFLLFLPTSWERIIIASYHFFTPHSTEHCVLIAIPPPLRHQQKSEIIVAFLLLFKRNFY